MEILFWILGLLLFLSLSAVVVAYICFRMAFYVSKADRTPKEEYPIPEGKIYEPYREQMVAWMKEARAMECKHYTIRPVKPENPASLLSFGPLHTNSGSFTIC